MNEIKFCMFCGKALKMGYPGGDPENGPASMTCKDHGSPLDFVQMMNMNKSLIEIIQDARDFVKDADEFSVHEERLHLVTLDMLLEKALLPVAIELNKLEKARMDEENEQYEKYLEGQRLKGV